MYFCQHCDFNTHDLDAHLAHRFVHRNITNVIYCTYNKCGTIVTTQQQLQLHLEKSHHFSRNKDNPYAVHASNECGKFVCTVATCRKVFDRYRSLNKHLREHLTKNEEIECPVKGCEKKYKLLNS
ncbi:hypothetical protein QAD02_007998 [Eretmocerus hayati]|uniref:Uncharacterized protein n=1 Tax=Eretmocerus hayati TaxID=131215 RepID=A0ACC2N5H6_9HYME|nr:hypothetical protein QAD02_007998 [Eretmocerus hayati]